VSGCRGCGDDDDGGGGGEAAEDSDVCCGAVLLAFGRLLNHDYVTFVHVLTAAHNNYSHPDYQVSRSHHIWNSRSVSRSRH